MKKYFLVFLAILGLVDILFSQEILFDEKAKEVNHLRFRLNRGDFLNVGVFKKMPNQQKGDSVGYIMSGRLADTVVIKMVGKFKYVVRPENEYISVTTIQFPGNEIMHSISFPENTGTAYFNTCLSEENYYFGRMFVISCEKYKKQNHSAELSRR
ncbi:hypothetical protein COX27_01170 [Candidatus Kuenenbacteria bacterium CG23_combo_of_CG06-09_8_20_14_all_36_9]|nr:MAG: hypothetical protein COX27_01170 [Candidatus Kuenenbacteria bacterium CG23_combo_of_CG06-09_8_20_14_all_36_9]